MAPRTLLLLASLAVVAPALRLQGREVAEAPTHKEDCGKKLPVAASLAQLAAAGVERLPGAGFGEIQPYMTVLKDGFWEVDCVKDYLLEHGDKFGGNKFSYKLGARSNVSIVRYLDHVPKQKQDDMTHKVCFNFCRSIPLMSFFGLAHGRDCYCMPYYEQMAGDSSECNAVCEGDTTTMCGGMAKSSIFQMHACGDTAEELSGMADRMGDLSKALGTLLGEGEQCAKGLQESATTMLPMFGELHNKGAYDLMQVAKGAASDVRVAMKAASGKEDGLIKLMEEAAGMRGADLESAEEMSKAEAIIEKANGFAVETEDVTRALADLVKGCQGPKGGSLSTYVAVTYLIDKAFESAPSTCGGAVLGVPILGAAPEACAAACDADVMKCNGFSYFAAADKPVCFLLSKLTTASWYTGPGCLAEEAELLQAAQPTPPVAKNEGPTAPVPKNEGPTAPVPKGTHAAPSGTKCYAKFQNFEGVSLKPDPSGKCELCLETATNLDTCPLPH